MLSRFLTWREQVVLLAIAAAILIGAAALLLHSRWAAHPSEPAVAIPEVAQVLPAAPAAPAPEIPSPPASAPPAAPEKPEIASEPTPSLVLTVSVVGAVRRPGVYQFGAEDRVNDAVQEAGGTLGSADMSDINLAAPLVDGTSLIIPFSALAAAEAGIPAPPGIYNPPEYTISGWRAAIAHPNGAPTRSTGNLPAAGGLVDLNRASQVELESLPGIGPKLAQEIMRYREEQPFRSIEDLDNVSGFGAKRIEALRHLITVAPAAAR